VYAEDAGLMRLLKIEALARREEEPGDQ